MAFIIERGYLGKRMRKPTKAELKNNMADFRKIDRHFYTTKDEAESASPADQPAESEDVKAGAEVKVEYATRDKRADRKPSAKKPVTKASKEKPDKTVEKPEDSTVDLSDLDDDGVVYEDGE